MHPWEIDHGQPRVAKASTFFKFRHYTNLNKTVYKLSSFIENLKQHRFITCYGYQLKAGHLVISRSYSRVGIARQSMQFAEIAH
ncbi:MAG: DUF3473 domain-containing protein [Thermodesulfobacteriota bacterium]|nr:DUF3473 domain-containing protein [Thermodesulfobacteriota bacterium]